MSAINYHLGLSKFNTKANIDNINDNKDELTLNSNYKSPHINHKLCEKIDNLLHKENLTNNEKDIVLKYFNKCKDLESSSKHKMHHNSPKSPTPKKRQNKDINLKFKVKNDSIENEKMEKEKTLNKENNNIILQEISAKAFKISRFRAFLCCLETN